MARAQPAAADQQDQEREWPRFLSRAVTSVLRHEDQWPRPISEADLHRKIRREHTFSELQKCVRFEKREDGSPRFVVSINHDIVFVELGRPGRPHIQRGEHRGPIQPLRQAAATAATQQPMAQAQPTQGEAPPARNAPPPQDAHRSQAAAPSD